MLKKLAIVIAGCLILAALGGLFILLTFLPYSSETEIAYRNGDIVFQTEPSSQMPAILAATTSFYTHTGIIEIRDGKPYVIDSAGIVKSWPLSEWLSHGISEKFSLYRFQNLTNEQGKAIIENAKTYYGRRYDRLFSFDNQELYCSELPYLAYKKIGLELGKVQSAGELKLRNPLTRKLIESRWHMLPQCKNNKDFASCYQIILDQKLITPVSIADDPNMTKLYSNYLFGLL